MATPQPSMRAAVIMRYGKLEDVLTIGEVPRPQPQAGEVLVEMRAVAVNPIDFKTINGDVHQLHPFTFPKVPGEDGAGVVVALGPNAGSRVQVGDEVYFCAGNVRQFGSFADYCALPEAYVTRRPKNTSWQESASLPLVALTGIMALRDKALFKPGDKVFIQSGAGGIGSFAIQWAKVFGASQIATTASPSNFEFVKSLGADICIDYKTQKFEDVVKDYDIAYDTISDESIRRCFQCVHRGGTVVGIAGMPDRLTLREAGFNPVSAGLLGLVLQGGNQMKSQSTGVRFKFLFARADGALLDEVTRMVESGQIKAQVGRVYDSLDAVSAALVQLRDGPSVRGKIVITVKP